MPTSHLSSQIRNGTPRNIAPTLLYPRRPSLFNLLEKSGGERQLHTSQPVKAEYRTLKNIQHKRTWLSALKTRQELEAKAAAKELVDGKAAGKLKRGIDGLPVVEGGEPLRLDLTPKRMGDSLVTFSLPFRKDEWLVDSYVNANGQLRLGSLFEDLDALAGQIAYQHTGPGPTTVTAAVDRISIISPLRSFCDLSLTGFVSYVGRSSMEVTIEVRKVSTPPSSPLPDAGRDGFLDGEVGEQDADGDMFMTCFFTMVALDPSSKRPIAVPPLLLETPEEEQIFARGEANKQTKLATSKLSLDKQTPNDEESDLIHALHLKAKAIRKGVEPAVPFMGATKHSSTQLMQPQYRNRHSYMIFGGYLLSSTFELAFVCASAFARSRPRFVSLDPSTFEQPVPVGSILYLEACVAYTEPAWPKEGTRVQVRVESKIRMPGGAAGEEKGTGVFNYTFWCEEEGLGVMPVTYEEFMVFVDARRRAGRQREWVEGHGQGEGHGKMQVEGVAREWFGNRN
ncbi:Thioesterase/thiol ester dehydrase-isomerase [Ascobolus immersus RN42]|uniref:Thioesterase/thiol ester dehydrase-isomerase n=1 Tax=Ascobolus immersus RN42 TaxID=1160509 RepID=A0A3N4I210_ASCIM|nr:Thioesterase/thiol ester dehydrase-isomerase [Ascobolus immersus RN42]